MAAGASAVERIVGWLIPPASREEVLGDLRERCGANFLGEALRVVPFVIVSRIRRTADPVMVLMETLGVFLPFVLAARLDRRLFEEPSGLARLETPVAIVILVLLLADAYADPKKRSPLRAVLAPTLGMAIAFAVPVLPWPVMMWAGISAVGIVTAIRVIFSPVGPQAARIPAHWQKLELDAVSLQAARLLLPIAVIVLLWLALSRWRNG